MKNRIRATVYCKIIILLAGILGGAASVPAIAQNSAEPNKTYEFVNGRWYDGKNFKRRVFYASGGFFSSKKPAKIDKSVDLGGGFVIPPFGEAHTHNLDGKRGLENTIKAYLAEGTFYAQVLANSSTGADAARPLLNKPSTLDAVYGNGMLTCTYGHPFMVYEPLAMGIYSPAEAYRRVDEIKKSRLVENNSYWFLDSKKDVDEKWGKFLSSAPDIVKIGLLDAENYDKHVAAGETLNKGLSPEVAAYVVEKVHRAGLRVYAHIETPADFRLGLKIGVDGFAHAPGYGWKGTLDTAPKNDLTAADARLAARKKIVVIPTANIGNGATVDYAPDGAAITPADRERFPRVVARQKSLFELLRKNGVLIALGSDYFGRTLSEELWYLHDNRIFDNRTLLKLASEITPQTIFPKRRIGKLADGYEASFLVLGGDPIENFAEIKNIRMKFKQGIELK